MSRKSGRGRTSMRPSGTSRHEAAAPSVSCSSAFQHLDRARKKIVAAEIARLERKSQPRLAVADQHRHAGVDLRPDLQRTPLRKPRRRRRTFRRPPPPAAGSPRRQPSAQVRQRSSRTAWPAARAHICPALPKPPPARPSNRSAAPHRGLPRESRGNVSRRHPHRALRRRRAAARDGRCDRRRSAGASPPSNCPTGRWQDR